MPRGLVVLAALPVFVLGGLLLVDLQGGMLGLLSDDAFYYLKIARSIVDGHGSSFDGLTATNGYHPLWMLCMVAVARAAGSAPMAAVVATLLLCGIVCGLTLALAQRTTERWLAPGFGAVAVSVFLSPLLLGALTNGLETGILLLAIVFLCWCSQRHGLLAPNAGAAARFALGLLLGLVFLCRLDAAFLVLCAGILVFASGLLARVPFATLLGRSLAMVGGVLVLALPFFVWNQVEFGRLAPISGLVKSTFPALNPHLALQGDMRFGCAVALLSLLLAVFVARADLRRGRSLAEVVCSPLSLLAAGALAHFLYALLFMSWGIYWWHFVADGAALAFGAAQFCDRVAWNRAAVRSIARLVPWAVGIGGIGLQVWLWADKSGRHREWYQAAQWAREHTEPDAIFAMKDAGLFGYFSERRVINLDGKANSYAFLERLNRGEVLDYLREAGVRYIADVNASYLEGRAALEIPRARQPGQKLSLRREDERYHGAAYTGRPFLGSDAGQACFAIWAFGEPH